MYEIPDIIHTISFAMFWFGLVPASTHPHLLNSLAPGRSGCDSENGIFSPVLLIGIIKSSYDNVLRWMPQDLTDDKFTLVQVMAWCRQATSHSLNQCWPRSPTPYGVSRPQWSPRCPWSNHEEWCKIKWICCVFACANMPCSNDTTACRVLLLT